MFFFLGGVPGHPIRSFRATPVTQVAIMFEILLAFTVEAYIELREALEKNETARKKHSASISWVALLLLFNEKEGRVGLPCRSPLKMD